MRNKSGFHLSKWYFDLVTEEGKVFIGYFAVLKWKVFTFHFSSFLLHSNKHSTGKLTWLKQPVPVENKNSINWTSPRLNIDAEWNSNFEAINVELLNTNNKFIRWNCICPSGTVKIKIGNKKYSGYGYAEKLDMTIKPWQLPIKELRWGRFISEKNFLIWIDWHGGKENEKWVWHNGKRINNCTITDDQIIVSGRILQLNKFSTLREGTLASTSLEHTPKNFSVFPKNIFNSIEHKWLSKGTLIEPGKETDSGWAIHEVILWK